MDSAVLLLKTVGVSPSDGHDTERWMHCEAYSSSRDYEDHPIAFKCDPHGLPLNKIPEFGCSIRTLMTVNFTTSSSIPSSRIRGSFLELYLTDEGPKIQARIFIKDVEFDFILARIDQHGGRMFLDFTVNIESTFTYTDGNVWNFPEFPSALNLRVARRSGDFEIERWSVSFPYGELN